MTYLLVFIMYPYSVQRMRLHNIWRRADCGAEAAHRGGLWSPGWQAEAAARTADGKRGRPVREGRTHAGLVQRRHGHSVPTCDQIARRSQKVSHYPLHSFPRSAHFIHKAVVHTRHIFRWLQLAYLFISFRTTSKKFYPH